MECIPEEIVNAGAMAFERRFQDNLVGMRLFVATTDEDQEENNLWIYNFQPQEGLAGSWADDPILLPQPIGPGVALTFQPVVNYYWNPPPIGYLYLLVGNNTRYLYRYLFLQYPAMPERLYPGNGSVVTPDNLTFDWLPYWRWTGYDLQVSSRPDFTELLIDTTLSYGECTPRFTEPGIYYWRVRGLDAEGPLDWCEVWSFMLVDADGKSLGGYPQCPSEGGLMPGDEPVFDWQTVTDAVSYQLQVAQTPDFSRLVIDVTTPVSEFLSSETLQTNTYYWRTRYQDSNGNWSTWSNVISFPVEQGWQKLTDIPSESAVGAGGAMCYFNYKMYNEEKLYVLIGNGSREFWRLNFELNPLTWTQCENTRVPQTGGASLTPWDWYYTGTYQHIPLFAIMGGNHMIMYTYLPHHPRSSGDTWIHWGAALPRPCGYGSHIVKEEGTESYNLTLTIAGGYSTTNFYKEEYLLEEKEGQMASGSHKSEPERAEVTRSATEAHLHYVLNSSGRVYAEVFDATGRKVKTLFSGKQGKGTHSLTWNFTDESGRRVGAGVFFFSLDLTGNRVTLKLPVW